MVIKVYLGIHMPLVMSVVHLGEHRYSSTIPHFGMRRMCMVSFTPRPLYSKQKSPWNPLYRMLGGPQSQSGCYGEEKHLLPLLGMEL
jgi:hypothetical protein